MAGGVGSRIPKGVRYRRTINLPHGSVTVYGEEFFVDSVPEEFRSGYWHYLNDQSIDSENVLSGKEWMQRQQPQQDKGMTS